MNFCKIYFFFEEFYSYIETKPFYLGLIPFLVHVILANFGFSSDKKH